MGQSIHTVVALESLWSHLLLFLLPWPWPPLSTPLLAMPGMVDMVVMLGMLGMVDMLGITDMLPVILLELLAPLDMLLSPLVLLLPQLLVSMLGLMIQLSHIPVPIHLLNLMSMLRSQLSLMLMSRSHLSLMLMSGSLQNLTLMSRFQLRYIHIEPVAAYAAAPAYAGY